MATLVFRGDAPEVAQVTTATPANVDVDDVFTLTINGKAISYTAAANTVADVTAGLVAAWNAETEPEFEEITATDSTTHVTLTADTAGYPFTVTGSTSNGGGGNTDVLVVANTVAASGPSCVSVAANWSTGSLPANGDDIVFEYCDTDAIYGLDALAAITVNTITVKMSFTGAIGLPKTNENGYQEYRERYFKVGCNTADIGEGDGDGNGRWMFNVANTAPTITIHNAGGATDTGIPAVLITDTAANTVLTVAKGDAGLAFFAGETTDVLTLNVGYRDNVTGDAIVRCGSGTTLTTIVKSGGELTIESNVTTLTQDAGETTIGGAATATTINLNGGTLIDQSTGTFTTVNVLGGATYDKRQSLAAKTITNLNIYKDSAFHDPMGTVTLTNGIDLEQCRLTDVTIDRPPNKTWTETSI